MRVPPAKCRQVGGTKHVQRRIADPGEVVVFQAASHPEGVPPFVLQRSVQVRVLWCQGAKVLHLCGQSEKYVRDSSDSNPHQAQPVRHERLSEGSVILKLC